MFQTDIGAPIVLTATSHPSAAPHAHTVGFYESDRFLVELVADFLGPALERDETAFVIASGEHQRRFIDALRPRYPDIEVARRDGQLVLIDAHATRRVLVSEGVDGSGLDLDRFRELADELFAHVAFRGRPVRVFGYMAALLWADGDTTAALALEDQWNELARLHEFELMCAYPMHGFDGPGSDAAFASVCQRHSAMANESYAELGVPGTGGTGVVVLQRDEPDEEAAGDLLLEGGL